MKYNKNEYWIDIKRKRKVFRIPFKFTSTLTHSVTLNGISMARGREADYIARNYTITFNSNLLTGDRLLILRK